MPEVISLDEVPQALPGEEETDLGNDTVLCPECQLPFKSRGLTRHLSTTHGIENPNKRTNNAGKRSDALAVRWAEFQRGSALFISFACSQCAAVLVEDAEKDGEAIAAFCAKRPKLKKQIEQVLGGMDVMILVGALGGTAQKMLAHHSIGRQLHLPGSEQQHAAQHGAQEKMMDFLSQLDPSARHQLLDQVFSAADAARANTTVDVNTPVTATVTLSDDVPGAPPQSDTFLTEEDKYAMAAAHSSTGEWSST